jgi:hypothetical protein
MKSPIKQRQEIIKSLVANEIHIQQAVDLLGCSQRSVERYRRVYLALGEVGLIDHRKSNYHKLTSGAKKAIINLKTQDRWRSARNIRDRLNLPVSEWTVAHVIREAGLAKQNLKRVKPLIRFEARYPNELWQTDIMGKIDFPNLGVLYLIAALDDCSRFVLAGRWFRKQGKMNVFQIWYKALSRWGLPEKMLQDEGSQYKARTRFGQGDYQWYAKTLGIKLIWARRAQTKGKIERFWKFVQSDFVREAWGAKTIDEVNGKFGIWLGKYNYQFKSRYFGGITRDSRYQSSKRRLNRIELKTLLVVEERRRVTRESTISLYGEHYLVPPGYIGCRIWVKILGNKLLFEANGEVFHKTRLKLS